MNNKKQKKPTAEQSKEEGAEITLIPVDKPLRKEEAWYRKDSEMRRDKIIKTISEASDFSTTLKEIFLYNEHLHSEILWVESVVAALLRPYSKAGVEKEAI